MNTIKIEVNGLDINQLAEKLDNLANALNGKTTEPQAEGNEEKLLTRMEVAKLLGVTLPTINDWTKKGLIVGYRIGNRVRYKHSEILESLAKK